jgi:uncharacterized protein YdcH (DUF465 family)
MIEDEEFRDLQRKCKEKGWDFDRLIAFANMLQHIIIKHRHNKYGQKETFITCYKSKKAHHKIPADHRANF